MNKQTGLRCVPWPASINKTTFVCNESVTSADIHVTTFSVKKYV